MKNIINIINFIIFFLASNSGFAMNNEIEIHQSEKPEQEVTIISTDDKVFTMNLKVAKTSQTLKNMMEDIEPEAEENDIYLPFSSAQFKIILSAMHNISSQNFIKLSKKKSKKNNQKKLALHLQKIVANLKSNDKPLSNQQLIEFITGANYLDISFFKSEISLVESGLKALAKRILNTDEWLALESLSDKLIDLWKFHPAKNLALKGLSLKHTRCNGVIESSNGNNLISCGAGSIKIWNKDNLKNPITFHHPDCDNVIENTDDQKLISSSYRDSTIKIWDINNLNKDPITIMYLGYLSIIENANGKKLISYGDNTIKIWDINHLDQASITLRHLGCNKIIESLNKKKLISWSRINDTIKIWYKENLQNPITLQHRECNNVIESTDGQKLISCGDNTIKIWNVNNLNQDPITLQHFQCVSIIESTDGQKLISCGGNTIKIWNINHLYAKPITLQHSQCFSLIESLDGNNYISLSWLKNTIKIWNINHLYAKPITLKHRYVTQIIESSNGNLISWSIYKGTIKIWDKALLNPTPKQIHLLLAVYFASKGSQNFDLPAEKLSGLKIIFNELSSIAQVSLKRKVPHLISTIKKAV